ncbi:hypothetical protein TNCV_1279491 [Trichonephila clavipes]|nr:hypothetical protein TNCV_1279491 [Trichonephila clavipes]
MTVSRRFPETHVLNYVKILVIGAPGCGKTHLIESFISHFDERYVVRDSTACQVSFELDNHPFSVRIWELSSIFPPDSNVMQLLFSIDVVVYCYSVDDPDGLIFIAGLLGKRSNVGKFPSVLVGNKVDMRNRLETVNLWNQVNDSFVSYSEAMIISEIFGISWLVECSAETGLSVREAFEAAVYSFYGRKGKRKRMDLCLTTDHRLITTVWSLLRYSERQ